MEERVDDGEQAPGVPGLYRDGDLVGRPFSRDDRCRAGVCRGVERKDEDG